MGRTYPGAGASIGASMVFAYIASKHATTRAVETAVRRNSVFRKERVDLESAVNDMRHE